MLPSLSEQLTTRFYEWEQRGRGWHSCDIPVDLEPEFYPFLGHFATPLPASDDGKRHTLLSGFVSLFSGNKKVPEPAGNPMGKMPPVVGYSFDNDEALQVYKITLPKDAKLSVEDTEQLLLMVSYTNCPISFEIVATYTEIAIQFVCRQSDREQVYGQTKAYFPQAVLTPHEEGLEVLNENQTCVIDFGLADEFMRPIRMADEVEHDPYVGLFAALENILKGERGIVQILFKGAVNPWAESIMRSVTCSDGSSFFDDAPDMVKLAQEKVSAPLFSVCVKVAGQADRNERAIQIARDIGSALVHLTASRSNNLRMLSHNDDMVDDLIDDVLLRQSHRLGMLLNSRELATLVHFPTPEIQSSKVVRDTRKTKTAPDSTRGHKFILGLNSHHGEEQLVTVPASLRLRHTHVIGATGTGKSTMLLSMIGQDILYGNGLAVLDPHGDLIEAILPYVPRERIDDVIVVDPADGEYPVAFNILSAHSEIEKDILSSDLVAAFRRLSTSWGDQMNSVLANAILAFLESTEGGTLVDLRRFLVEPAYRNTYLKTVSDQHVVYYWQHEYPLLKSNSIGSILTRLDTFLRPKLIRNMVAQKKGLDFENILDTKKILLVKLSQGLIGAENSFLLGTFFVSKMYQAAMARQAKAHSERNDFFLYIDEFQHFITPSMSHILSGARKYHLGLILAHQDMQQLQKYDSELASSVAVNAGTRICFRLGDTDAKRFAGGFSYFDAEDLENLQTGEAIARVEQPNHDFNLSTIRIGDIDVNEADVTTKLAIAKSREKYGTRKEIVEASLQHLGKTQLNALTEKEANIVPELVKELVPAQTTEPFIPVEIPLQKSAVKKSEQTQHRYLQMLIKRTAETRGYKAILEALTPDGKYRVDVSLEKGGKKIACEISVTTSEEWEVHNVEKCLVAGYNEVIVCADNRKHLAKIKSKLEQKMSVAILSKIKTLNKDEIVHYLDESFDYLTTEKIVKGYRVKVEYDNKDTNIE